jgi:hypothetical protein
VFMCRTTTRRCATWSVAWSHSISVDLPAPSSPENVITTPRPFPLAAPAARVRQFLQPVQPSC